MKFLFTFHFLFTGLTWVFGYLAIADARILFHYIFTLLNSLQGFFIFVLFVARKKKVRDQWLILCCRQPSAEKASRTLSASSNSVPSTYSTDSKSHTGNARQDSTRSTTSFINHGYESFYVPAPFRRAHYQHVWRTLLQCIIRIWEKIPQLVLYWSFRHNLLVKIFTIEMDFGNHCELFNFCYLRYFFLCYVIWFDTLR